MLVILSNAWSFNLFLIYFIRLFEAGLFENYLQIILMVYLQMMFYEHVEIFRLNS